MDCGAVKTQSLAGLGACGAVGVDIGTAGRWLGAGCLGVVLRSADHDSFFLSPLSSQVIKCFKGKEGGNIGYRRKKKAVNPNSGYK